MERQNLKTRMFNSQQMVKEIKKSIGEFGLNLKQEK